MATYAVLDFETTGMSPGQGACATEIGIVLVRDGAIAERFQSLMNGGVRLSSFIENYTGITNAMVRKAPPIQEVMAQACAFVGHHPLVAHNASFDTKFWDAGLQAIGQERRQDFLCSVRLSRRVFSNLTNHRLGTMVQSLNLPMSGNFHRALADAEATAHLFIRLQAEIKAKLKLEEVTLQHMQAVQRLKIGTF
ncbi:MAG: 3'-5' exonuclease [Hyphomicrobiales bacterium]|nr:3'-5' exonuclease [Hyphomicrobiales bacterium]MDE2115332.1 3'-5' exonuclease [Hyphomicrobiales bacterium]